MPIINNVSSRFAVDAYNKSVHATIEPIRALAIEDTVSINQKTEHIGINDLIGNTQQAVLLEGDNIIVSGAIKQNKGAENSFFDFLQGKFNSLKKSEQTSQQATNYDSNMLELATSLTEAEQTLDVMINVRDKIVSSLKELLSTTF